MNSNVLQSNYNSELFYEKRLQNHLYALSVSMPSCLVETILNSLCSKTTITTYESQMIRSQLTDMQKACQLIQTVMRKGRTACQLFYKLLESCDPMLFERVTGSPAKVSGMGKPQTLHDVLTEQQDKVPTFINIINIQDSTLSNCIIGSRNGQHINTEQHELSSLLSDKLRRDGTERCSCMCGHQGSLQPSLAPQSIQVHSSQLENVIIGDHNMQLVQEAGEEEEEEDDEQTAPGLEQ